MSGIGPSQSSHLVFGLWAEYIHVLEYQLHTRSVGQWRCILHVLFHLIKLYSICVTNKLRLIRFCMKPSSCGGAG